MENILKQKYGWIRVFGMLEKEYMGVCDGYTGEK
jgi:hypothetical protein